MSGAPASGQTGMLETGNLPGSSEVYAEQYIPQETNMQYFNQ